MAADDSVPEKKPDTETLFERSRSLKLFGELLEQVLYIGDQTTRRLTWAHIMRLFHSINLVDTKLGTFPAAGHFHTQMKKGSCITRTIDDKKSTLDRGSYRNLEDAVGRTNSMGKKWPAAYDQKRRFCKDVLKVWSVGFAMEHFGMSSTDAPPTRNAIPADCKTKEQEKAWFQEQMRTIVRAIFSFHHNWTEEKHENSHAEAIAELKERKRQQSLYHFCSCGSSFKTRYGPEMTKHLKDCKWDGESRIPKGASEMKRPDDVYAYTVRGWNELMLFFSYEEFIRFGNGPKMIEVQAKWMFPLTSIHSSRSHYSYEGLYTGVMTECILSLRMAEKMIWGGVCCGHDMPGENNPGDHRIENVNRTGKDVLRHKGHQNMDRIDVNAVGKTFLPLHDACEHFDRVSRVARGSAYCNTRYKANSDDEKVMLQICLDAKIFQEYPPEFPLGRFHRPFEGIRKNPFDDVKIDGLRAYWRRWAGRFGRWQRSTMCRLYTIP